MSYLVAEALSRYGATEVIAILSKEVGPLGGDESKSIVSAFLRTNPFDPMVIPAAGTSTTASFFPMLGVVIGYVDSDGYTALQKNGLVESIALAPELSLIRGEFSTNGVAESWHIDHFGLPALWEAGYRGQGVEIGHLDTGVNQHDMLKGAIAEKVVIGPDGKVDISATFADDSSGHGTHTAGILVGREYMGRNYGVAPMARLLTAKVVGTNSKTRLLGGLEWLLTRQARIISISLGVMGYSDFLETVFERIRSAGVLPVVAIGNEGAGTSRSPGNYSSCLSVGAVDQSNLIWSDSGSIRFNRESRPTRPDLVAPGASVASASSDGGVKLLSGTSQAAPFVAGVAALLSCARPDMPLVDIESSMLDTAELATLDSVRAGRGLINPGKALELLLTK